MDYLVGRGQGCVSGRTQEHTKIVQSSVVGTARFRFSFSATTARRSPLFAGGLGLIGLLARRGSGENRNLISVVGAENPGEMPGVFVG
jgi:hypothetical protein